ncbi:hypothetical protein [Deinococcus multiflagellatus]|uniref:Uncharacterized protein n=1 Tax=Deinococcus multiflagellatus TaxID=1656887 RepID=A0ABW1ZH00_9DEIO|nr:hypothetical protein [Deinococcus multiflagellatus]MBZ9712164.1 hypothetical protein [Deinococcus multiflagellatus]
MQKDLRPISQDFATNRNYPEFLEYAEGFSVYVRTRNNSATFDAINDDSPVETNYMLTTVRVMCNLPGVHLTAQVEGGKLSEVLPKVERLLAQLEK